MNTLNKQLDLAREAWDKAGTAQKALNDLRAKQRANDAFLAQSKLKDADEKIRSFMRTATEVAVLIERKIKERQAKFDAAPVLEAVITNGSDARKIVVAKPNERIDEPHITESFFTAIRAKWSGGEIVTTEDYNIIIVNRKGRAIGEIKQQH